jgi:hypothetical protein
MLKPNITAWAIIWLSKTKSSEFSSKGRVSSSSREKARKPVWYSESLTPRIRVLEGREQAVGDVLIERHSALQRAAPRIREPRTIS